MPYGSTNELPAAAQRLPRKQRRQWARVFNSACERAVSEGTPGNEAGRLACASAWAAVNGPKKFTEDVLAGEEVGVTKDELLELAEKFPLYLSILGLNAQDIQPADCADGARAGTEKAAMNTEFPGEIRLLVPITKIDKEKRMVRGVATAEVLDSYDEVLTYDGSKEAMKTWVGNVREMHQPKAVGKRVEVEFDDTTKEIVVTTYISKGAPDTWEKVVDGTLSMYSVGGARTKSVIKAGEDCPEHVFMGATSRPKKVRWTEAWKMHELSVVDAGANPKTSFDLVKFKDGELTVTDIIDSGEAENPLNVDAPPVDASAAPGDAPSGAEPEAEAAAKPASDGENNQPQIAEQASPDPIGASAPAASAPPPERGTVNSGQGTEKNEDAAPETRNTEPAAIPDGAFALAHEGARHYQVKDADGNPVAALVRDALRSAAKAIQAGGSGAEIARKALPKIKASAKKLTLGEFRSDPERFLAGHDVFEIGYGYEDELESETPLDAEAVQAYIAEHGDEPILIFKAHPVTFGAAHDRYVAREPERHVWDWLDILMWVCANILLSTELATEERLNLVAQSFTEFLAVIGPEAEAATEQRNEDVANATPGGDIATAAAPPPQQGDEMTKEFEGALMKRLDEMKASLDAVAAQQGEQEKISREIEGRLKRVEGTPVIPEGAVLKNVAKAGAGESRQAEDPQSLPDLQKRCDETVAEFKKLQEGDPRREALQIESFKIAREIKIATGQPVWGPV